MFNCEKDVDTTNICMQSFKSELNYLFVKETSNIDVLEKIRIDGRIYHQSLVLLEGHELFSIARRAWRQLEAVVFDEISSSNIDIGCTREQLVDLLRLCRCSIQTNSGFLTQNLVNYIQTLRTAMTKWKDLDEKLLNKLCSQRFLYNEALVYHYFHMYLEISWLILTLSHLCCLELITVQEIIKDIALLQCLYYKKQQLDIHSKNLKAFVCPCIKHFLLLLILYCDKCDRNFWDIFNICVKEMDEPFVLWFLSNVAKLQGYNEEGVFVGPQSENIQENHNLLELKLKKLEIKDDYELLKSLRCVNVLLNELWVKSFKADAYNILWELVYKHINNFQGLHGKNLADIIEFVDTVAYNECATNSYQYYLYMLIGFLTRYPNQWVKIRGRIYSKLPPHKIKHFSDTGILNIACLYMSLMRENVKEMADKLLPLLENVTGDRRNSSLIINIYMAVILVYVRRGFPITDMSTPLLEIIENIVEHRDKFYLIREYIEGIELLLKIQQDFNTQHYVLFGKWVSKYIPHCQFNDLCYFLDLLILIVKRVQMAGTCKDWQHVLNENVLSSLKIIASFSSSPPQVGELAAIIDQNPLSHNVLIFTKDTVVPKVSCQYMTTILDNVSNNYQPTKSHETAILHAWTRCCLLNCENIENLTKNVIKLSVLSTLFGTSTTNYSLCSLIINMGKLKNKNMQELCEQCFGKVDTWLGQYLTTPSTEAQTFHIYTCMALLFYHCATLLYHKQRSNCLLNKLISLLLLPTDVLVGKPLHPYILSSIQRTWHLFVEGIFMLCDGDAYIDRTLRDLVVRYIPFFQICDTPILKCLQKEKLTATIFRKIDVGCLSQTSRSEGNSVKALKIVHVSLQNATPAVARIILENTLTSVLEIIIFHNDKASALEIIRFIQGDFKDLLKNSICVVTERHLAFSSHHYFQFTNVLVNIVPDEMRNVLPHIKKQVAEVERRRGVGYDNTLRLALEKLITLLS